MGSFSTDVPIMAVQGIPVQQGVPPPPPPPPLQQDAARRIEKPRKEFYGPFDCYSDPETCLGACCCQPCAMAQIGERLQMCGGCKLVLLALLAPGIVWSIVFLITFDVQMKAATEQNMTTDEQATLQRSDAFLGSLQLFIHIYVLSFLCQARQKIQLEYGMASSALGDFCCVLCCTWCILCEVANNVHSKENGLCGKPDRWRGPPNNGSAMIRGHGPRHQQQVPATAYVQAQPVHPTAQPVVVVSKS